MAFAQPVAQMGQPVAWVGQGLVAQALVCGQQLGQVAELGGQRPVLTRLCGGKQGFGRDRTGLALIHQPQRLLQQFGLVRQPLPRGQAALHPACGLLQSQKLPRRGEHLLGQPAHLGEHAVRQARKRQHFGRARAVVAGRLGQPSLHPVRVQLGYEQNLPPLARLAPGGNLL